MEKVPFSPSGFKQLETQLYALSDHALQAEANAILADYVDWVEQHVVLNTEQVVYLQGLDSLFIAYLASNAAIAFVNRLPLNLILPSDYNSLSQEERKGKWFLDASNIIPSNSPGKPVEATGELTYEFMIL